MKNYIESVLPKIMSYSKRLDTLSILSDVAWKVINEKSSEQKMIFKGDGKIIFSENGSVKIGKWELLNKANSVLIEFDNNIKLYNHGFLDDCLLILRIDGLQEYFILANEHKIGKEEIETYIQSKYVNAGKSKISENGIRLGSEKIISDKGELTIFFKTTINSPTIGDEVYVVDHKASDGKYRLGSMFYIYVKEGKVAKTSIF